MDLLSALGLGLLAFGAAIVNGAVGYGFSSIVTPIAILWISNRTLNPAIVAVELIVNLTLLLRERELLTATWWRSGPVILTLLPGVFLGTLGLALLPVLLVKFAVYAVLLPLIALQILGAVIPIRNYRTAGRILGPGVGFLYALTTISGPPLALFYRNQGLAKGEFRAAMAQVRLAESAMTLSMYAAFTWLLGSGLTTLPAVSLLPSLLIPVVIGVPLGALLLGRVSAEGFRRFILNLDGLIASFGLSQVVVVLGWGSVASALTVMMALTTLVVSLTVYAYVRDSSQSGAGPTAARSRAHDPPPSPWPPP